jgi:hypothetical protein
MADKSFTRRRFMLLSAGAAALIATPKSGGVSQGTVITHQSGTNSEMVMAQAWARAFRLPGAKSEPAAGRDRATVFVRICRTPVCGSTSNLEIRSQRLGSGCHKALSLGLAVRA